MLPRPTSHSAALGPGVAGPALAVPTPLAADPQARPAGPPPPHVPLCGSEAFAVDPAALAGGGEPRRHTP